MTTPADLQAATIEDIWQELKSRYPAVVLIYDDHTRRGDHICGSAKDIIFLLQTALHSTSARCAELSLISERDNSRACHDSPPPPSLN